MIKHPMDMHNEFEQAKDEGSLLELLLEEVKLPVKLYALWEWKEHFYLLSDEEYEKHPELASAMVMIKAMEGRIDEAHKYLEYTKKLTYVYDYTRLLSPYTENEDFLQAVEQTIQSGVTKNPKLTLTASRPSVLNGFKDFSIYADLIKGNKEIIVKYLEALYGEASTGVYEIALAEALYWADECFDALVTVVGTIPFMEGKKDVRCLFAALTLEMYILVINGQAKAAHPLMENLSKRIHDEGKDELEGNLKALEAWAALYDGDYRKVNNWMKCEAPDEYTDFNMLDTYRYMIKLRCYLVQKKHIALYSLAERLKPLLQQGNRIMDICELNIIIAMSCYEQGRKEQAYDIMDNVLHEAERYRYDRLIGDEGQLMYQLLLEYRKHRGKRPYLEKLIDIARRVGLLYPNYLVELSDDIPKLSTVEQNVLKLMSEEKSNADIAQYLQVSLNTIKFHSKNIYKKLTVKSRGQAVKRGRELGILE